MHRRRSPDVSWPKPSSRKTEGERRKTFFDPRLLFGQLTGYRYVQAATQQDAGSFDGAVGIRVDDQSLDDLNAYVVNLPSPLATAYDLDAAIEGREDFQAFGCVDCHRAEGGEPVAPFVVPIAELWPGYNPMMIAERQDPLNDVQNSPGTYDDRVVVLNASLRGEPRGYEQALTP